MKIRTDFVTNSSSSSFIIARKDELSEHLKEIIVKFVADEMFGEKMLTPNSTEEDIQKVFEDNYIEEEERQQEIRNALKADRSVYGGWVNFECCEYGYAGLFERLWAKMESAGEKDFEVIDGDLSY